MYCLLLPVCCLWYLCSLLKLSVLCIKLCARQRRRRRRLRLRRRRRLWRRRRVVTRGFHLCTLPWQVIATPHVPSLIWPLITASSSLASSSDVIHRRQCPSVQAPLSLPFPCVSQPLSLAVPHCPCMMARTALLCSVLGIRDAPHTRKCKARAGGAEQHAPPPATRHPPARIAISAAATHHTLRPLL
jgi:hypothetical protein